MSGGGTSRIDWLLFLIGGVLGLLLMIVLFSWALIILSSLAGAGLIMETLSVDQWVRTLLFIVLFIVGVTVQSRLMKMKQS